jgi:hypothetical protein
VFWDLEGIKRANADGSSASAVLLTDALIGDQQPIVSPDGTYVYFWDSFFDEIFRLDWPNGGNRTLLTDTAGGNHPAPSPDGTKVAFDTGDDGLAMVDAPAGGNLTSIIADAGRDEAHWGRFVPSGGGGAAAPPVQPPPVAPEPGSISGTAFQRGSFFSFLCAFLPGFPGCRPVPLSGVDVSVPAASDTSGAGGTYLIGGLGPGSHTVTATVTQRSFSFFGGGVERTVPCNANSVTGPTSLTVAVSSGMTTEVDWYCPAPSLFGGLLAGFGGWVGFLSG